MKAIIVDDLSDARLAIRADVEAYCPQVEIVGEADGVVSGAKLIKEVDPDLVFLDIQMQDGSGFDLLEITGTDRFKVIFTTASDEHAVKAFKFSAVDYLMKPIDPDELTEAVEKSLKSTHSGSIEVLKDAIKDGSTKRIALNTQEKILIREISEIVDGPISVEVISLDAQGMIDEGRDIAGWIPDPWVKIVRKRTELCLQR